MKLLSAPISLDLAITGKCNLKCKYCSHFSGPGDVDNDLPGDEWQMFFEELNRYMVMRVTLQGAEPFFRKDIREIDYFSNKVTPKTIEFSSSVFGGMRPLSIRKKTALIIPHGSFPVKLYCKVAAE